MLVSFITTFRLAQSNGDSLSFFLNQHSIPIRVFSTALFLSFIQTQP